MISKNKKYSPSFGHDLSKSSESLFQQLKYKLESLLAVYCMGRYQTDILSQCIPNTQTSRGSAHRRTMDRASNGQDQNLRSVPVNRADCEELLVCGSTKAQLTQVSFDHTDSHFVCNLLSRFHTGATANPLLSFQYHCDCRAGLRLWTTCRAGVLTGITCSDLALGEPRITRWGGWCSQGRCACNTQSLALIGKALRKWTKVCEATQ